MANLLAQHFEAGVGDWTATNGTASQSNTQARTGTYSLKCQAGSSFAGQRLVTAPGSTTLYFQFGVFFESAWNTTEIGLYDGANRGVNLVWNSDGKVKAQYGTAGDSGLDDLVFATGQFYLMEVKVLLDASGTVDVWADGELILSATGDTRPAGSSTTIDRIRVALTGNARALYLDDVVLNDTAADATFDPNGEFVTRPSGAKVLFLRPNAAGNYSAWTPVGSGTNYQNVDEATPSATDYNETAAAAQRDSYGIEPFPTISGNFEIIGAQVRAWLWEANVTANVVDTFVRHGGADSDDGKNHTLPATMTERVGQMRAVTPGTSAAWTDADINALEIGVKS